MIYALVIIAILSPLAGFALGVHLARRSGADASHAHERAVTFLREGEALRHLVMNFVRRARLERPPTPADWHALVDAMLHSGTPAEIRRLHHEQCGTALPDQVTLSTQGDTELREDVS